VTEKCNLVSWSDIHSVSQGPHLNLAILGERRPLEVEATIQLVVHQVAGVLAEGALVRRAKDIGLPLECVGTVLNRTQHRLALQMEEQKVGQPLGACRQFAADLGPVAMK